MSSDPPAAQHFTPRQWWRLTALLLATLWLTLGLLGFLLLHKQHTLMLDLAVSRAAIIAGDIDASWRTGQQSGLRLEEARSLQGLLQRLQANSADLVRAELFGSQRIVYSSQPERIGHAVPADWLRLSQRDPALWRRETGNGRIEVGRRINDQLDRYAGGYVLTIDASRYYHQSEYARTAFLKTMLAGGLAAGLLLALALRLAVLRPLFGLSLRSRILAAALLVMCGSGVALAGQASRLFAAHLQPALALKADSVADFTAGKLERAMALGIPFGHLAGVDDYFAALLRQHPELQAIELHDHDGRLRHHGQANGLAGERLQRDVADPARSGQVVARLSVVTDAGYVAGQVRALAADIAIVLLVGLIVFNEALSALLGRLPHAGSNAVAARAGRLAAIRLPLFLFILTEELSRSFLPLHIRELAPAAGHAAQATLIGLPISVYMICFAVATPLAGGLADRHGAGKVFTAGALLSGAGFVWAALTGDFWQFVLARACCATGYALATMACQRAILADSDRQSRAQGLAMFIGAVGIAAICGSSIGGVLAERAGAAAVWLLAACLALLSLLLFFPVGNTVSQAGNDKPFAWIDLPRLLRQPRFALLMLGAAIPAKIALAGSLFYLAPLALAAAGYTPAAIGRAVMVYFILITVVTPLAARLSDRYQLRLSLVVAGGCIIGLGALAGWQGGAGGTLAGIVALGVGTGLSAAALQALANEVGTADGTIGQMASTAAFRTIERIGSAIGPILAGSLLLFTHYGGALAGIGALLLSGALLVWATFARASSCR